MESVPPSISASKNVFVCKAADINKDIVAQAHSEFHNPHMYY